MGVLNVLVAASLLCLQATMVKIANIPWQCSHFLHSPADAAKLE